MIRPTAWLILAAFAVLLSAAERSFDFSSTKPGTLPDGWKTELAGVGKPGDWRVVEEDLPPILEPLSPQAPRLTRKAVIAQTAPSNEDERFPLLIHNSERYGDFTFTRISAQGTGVGTDDKTTASWSYVLRNDAKNVQELIAGQKATDSITLPANLFDGANNVITVDITGADDAPVISGGTPNRALIEDGGKQNGTVGVATASGKLGSKRRTASGRLVLMV